MQIAQYLFIERLYKSNYTGNRDVVLNIRLIAIHVVIYK